MLFGRKTLTKCLGAFERQMCPIGAEKSLVRTRGYLLRPWYDNDIAVCEKSRGPIMGGGEDASI